MIAKRLTLLLTLLLAMVVGTNATDRNHDQDNDPEARKIFEKAYNQVFGPQGCTLHYDVNLIGVYKSAGTIWYKGKKNKFVDARADSWSDGTTMYTVYRKKKIIEISDARKNKYSSKFKFTLDDFYYTKELSDEGLLIKLKQRQGVRGTVKQAQVLLDAKTYAPISARIKVLLFWANIKVSNFRAGGITDDTFVFPRQKYGSEYKVVDRR